MMERKLTTKSRMVQRINVIICALLGAILFLYFIGPILGFEGSLTKYFSWVYDCKFFALSIGVFGGASMYLTGTMWPYVIQIFLYLLVWLLLYKLLKLLSLMVIKRS